jgi:hypothetical protein
MYFVDVGFMFTQGVESLLVKAFSFFPLAGIFAIGVVNVIVIVMAVGIFSIGSFTVMLLWLSARIRHHP